MRGERTRENKKGNIFFNMLPKKLGLHLHLRLNFDENKKQFYPFQINPSGTDNQNLSGCIQAVRKCPKVSVHNQVRYKGFLSGMLDIDRRPTFTYKGRP